MKTCLRVLGSNGVHYEKLCRYFSRTHRSSVFNYEEPKILSRKDGENFKSYLSSSFIKDAVHKDTVVDLPQANNRLEKLLKHTLITGKLHRAYLLIYTYRMIKSSSGGRLGETIDIYNLACCNEMLTSQFIVVDDLIDDQQIRRGLPTWHMLEGVGTNAVIDSYMIQFCMHRLLKKYFFHHPNYNKLLETFLELPLSYALVCEFSMKFPEEFTLDRWYAVAHSKTTYFSFQQIFQLAILLTGAEFSMIAMSEGALKQLGILFTMRNDLLDCYGEKTTSKPSSDIRQGNLNSLITSALLKASPTQRKVLEENYGKKEQHNIDTVKAIYDDLDILNEVRKLEKTHQEFLMEEIDKIPNELASSIMKKYAYAATYCEIGEPFL